jgi:8-oxo-dGTP pyrophosphatase MutT (NUDIX family)
MNTYSYSFTHLPPVTKRGGQVLIALFSSNLQDLYLSRKNVYPKGIYRLFGGGIDEHEEPLQTAPRELAEETRLNANPKDFIKINEFKYHILEQSINNHVDFSVYLYSFIVPQNQTIIPSDDVDEYKVFHQPELLELIKKYKNLPDQLVTNTFEGPFRWSDYGKVFAPIHQSVLDYWNSTLS